MALKKEEDNNYPDTMEFRHDGIIYTIEVVRFVYEVEEETKYGYAGRIWEGYPLEGLLLNAEDMPKFHTRDETHTWAWEWLKAYYRKK